MKTKRLPLLLLSFFLCSCSTNPLYAPPAYDGSLFEENYLRNYDEIGDKECSLIGERVVFQRATEAYEDGEAYFFDGDQESQSDSFPSFGMKDRYPELFTYTDADGKVVPYERLDSIASRLDDEGERSFGKDHALAHVDEGFKQGVLSKLYNGQLECHSWYANARVQMEEEGFKTLLPKTLVDGDVFALSLRGNTSENTEARFVTADVVLRFYVDHEGVYDYYELVYEKAMFPINSGGSAVSLVGSSLLDAFGESFFEKGIVGYAISFEMPEEGYFEGYENYRFSYAEEGPFFGFSVYEVMFIDSSWK